MYCRNCHLQYPDDAVFCSICGSALETPVAPPQEADIPPIDSEIEYVPAKPRRKGKIIAIVLAAVLSIALVAGLVSYLVMINNPVYQISSALNNSIEELMVNTPNLENAYQNLSTLLQERACTVKLDYTSSTSWNDGDSLDSSVCVELNCNADSMEMSGSIDVSNEEIWCGEFSSESFNFDFSADRENLCLHLAQLGNEVYSLPLANFGKYYEDSALADLIDADSVNDFLEDADFNPYADVSLTAFLETDAGEEFIDSLQIQKGEKTIPHTRDLTVYSAQIEVDELYDVLIDYYEFAITGLCGEKAARNLDLPKPNIEEDTVICIRLGINDDGCLVALHAYLKGSKDEAVTLVLDGEENIWDEVVLYVGDESYKIFIDQKKDGFTVSYKDSDGTRNKLITCDDGDSELIFHIDGEEYVLKYSDGDDGAGLTIRTHESSEYITCETKLKLQILPVEKIRQLSNNTVEILDMKKRELEDLLEALGNTF